MCTTGKESETWCISLENYSHSSVPEAEKCEVLPTSYGLGRGYGAGSR